MRKQRQETVVDVASGARFSLVCSKKFSTESQKATLWFLMGGYFATPRDIWLCLETFLVIMAGGVLLASGMQRPGMLLNIYHAPQQRIF